MVDFDNFTGKEDSSVEIPHTNLCFPAPYELIDEVIEDRDVTENTVVTALAEHHSDLLNEGTTYAFIRRLAKEGRCRCVSYTNSAIYLSVSPDVWADERSWLDTHEETFDSIVDIHTQLVEDIAEQVGVVPPDQAGYVIVSKYPIEDIARGDGVPCSAFEVCETAEFLEHDVGMGRDTAIAMTLYQLDAVNSRVVSNILGEEVDEVEATINRAIEWRDQVESICRTLGEDIDPQDLYGLAASVREED